MTNHSEGAGLKRRERFPETQIRREAAKRNTRSKLPVTLLLLVVCSCSAALQIKHIEAKRRIIRAQSHNVNKHASLREARRGVSVANLYCLELSIIPTTFLLVDF